MPMSNSLSSKFEDPEALPFNDRSTSFIDSVAFLEFVRLKSQAAPACGGEVKNGTAAGSGSAPAHDTPDGPGRTACCPAPGSPPDSRIDVEDWDSLFGAVEERLRATVENPDSSQTPQEAQSYASRIKSVVLDCLGAMDQLHQALKQERGMLAPAFASADADTSDATLASRLTNALGARKNN
jgi:hypothetical protein